MGLQSQARFLRWPSPRPLQVLRAGQVQNETESHLQHCAILTCLLANSCSISGGQDPQRTTGDGWGNAKCTPAYILNSISCNRGPLRTLRKNGHSWHHPHCYNTAGHCDFLGHHLPCNAVLPLLQ
jgi:hypothetical protein